MAGTGAGPGIPLASCYTPQHREAPPYPTQAPQQLQLHLQGLPVHAHHSTEIRQPADVEPFTSGGKNGSQAKIQYPLQMACVVVCINQSGQAFAGTAC